MIYCSMYAGSETSGGRTHKHNAAVGGVPGSPHVHFLGRDIIYDTPPVGDRKDYADKLGLELIEEADHDHLQPKGWVNS